MPSLDQLSAGQHALITGVEGGDALGQRLLEMGLLEGEPVEVLGFAPFGDPMEVRLRDYRLSLRRREAARVSVEVRDSAFHVELRPSNGENESHEVVSPVRTVPDTGRRTATVALVGNPNTGKTTLFNALAGMRQRVGNYPGVTVETKRGHMTWENWSFNLVDLPGTYSLAPRSPDEMLAVDLVLGQRPEDPEPDVLLSIVDASNLERNLYLTTQLLEVGIPVVVALNMMDVAQDQKLQLDIDRLSRKLGVPVVPIQANKHKNLDELKQAIAGAVSNPHVPRGPVFPEAFETEASALREIVGQDVSPFLLRRLLLDIGGYTEERFVAKHGEALRQRVQEARRRLADADCVVPDVEARVRYGWIREHIAGCIERPRERVSTATDRIDRILTHRVWGTLLFAALMALIFQAIFTWAEPLMGLIEAGVGGLADLVRDAMGPGPLTSLLADGIIGGVGAIIVFLPQILILFAFVAVLEDCGYMARVAFLMDRLMARCGLSGKSFLPMLSSVACAIPGILATRTIENRRDRLATIMVAPLMSCSARLPVYLILIAAFFTEGNPWWMPGLVLFCMYSLGVILAPLVAFALKGTLLRGATPPFVMEMPLYRWPSPPIVVRRMTDSAWEFIKRAGTIILASMIVVWALLYFPRGDSGNLPYDQQVIELRAEIETMKEEKAPEETIEEKEEELNHLQGEWRRQSYLGRMGKAIEPVVAPLGWDWKIGMATVASFPAREVIVGTLRIIYDLGDEEPDEDDPDTDPLKSRLQAATYDDNPERKVFSVPVALSIMVFFALCCQCASTLAVIWRETKSWGWPIFTFVYMTLLAYVGALLTYQIGSWIAS